MATPRFLSSTNGFIPHATGQAIAYVTDPKLFRINQYVQLVKSEKPVGVYAEIDPDMPVRYVTDDDRRWEDGDDAPEGNDNLANFKWTEFRVFRRAFPYSIGEESLQNADWDAKAFHNAAVLNQAMTNRTQRIITLLETSSNWPTDNTADANVLNNGAGTFTNASADPQDPAYLAIRKAMQEAVRRIVLKTNNLVQLEDLIAVISPGLALIMSQTGEINEFLKNNVYGKDQVTGNVPGQNALWGLPDHYAGIKLVVEPAVKVNTRANSAGTNATITGTSPQRLYIKQDTSMVICSRPGGIQGSYGAPSFSTIQLYYHKYEMAVEAKDDSWHKKYRARVVDKCKEVLAAGAAGFLITTTK